MAETFDEITKQLADFMGRQHVFFVATAPSRPDGHVNVSPKGLDTFRVLDTRTVAYLDLSGSGIETISHLRDNGRICVMFCAFEGPAQILRLHGHGEVVEAAEPGFQDLYALFEPRDHARAVIRIAVERIATSCGYAVPLYDFKGDRRVLDAYWERKSNELLEYRKAWNSTSVDGLPGLVHEPARPGAPPPAAAGRPERRQRGDRATRRPPSSS